MAESAAFHPLLGIPAVASLAVPLGLALAGLVIVLPALLVSTAPRKFFKHQDLEPDEPERRRFVPPSPMEVRPSAIAVKR